MKAKSLHKLRGSMTLKRACLLILLAVVMTSSLTVFAAPCPPGSQRRAKGDQSPQATSVATPPAQSGTPLAKNNSRNAVKLNTVVVVFNPANSATPVAPPLQMTTEQQALTTPKGSPLYYYDPDADPKKPICLKTLILATSVTCTAEWPPLLQPDGSSLTVTGLSKKLAVTKNDNGLQITFNGHLLYTYIKDQMPLIAIGDGGKSGPWHIAIPSTPLLLPSEKPVATPSTPVLLPSEKPATTLDTPVGQKLVATPSTSVLLPSEKPSATPDIPVGQKPT